MTIVAGNDGQERASDMSNGAADAHVLTIAASKPDEFPAQEFTANFILDDDNNATKLACYGRLSCLSEHGRRLAYSPSDVERICRS